MSWSTSHPALDHRLQQFAQYLTDHPDTEGDDLDDLADALDDLYSSTMPNEPKAQRPPKKNKEKSEHTHSISGTSSAPQTGANTPGTSADKS